MISLFFSFPKPPFRDEAERLNVWVALLSMEVTYGSDDVIEDTLKRALQCNNQLKIYSHMITVYNKANLREVRLILTISSYLACELFSEELFCFVSSNH